MNEQTKQPTASETLASAHKDMAMLNERVLVLTDQLADARKGLEATRAFLAGTETAFKAVQEKVEADRAAQKPAGDPTK